MRRVIAAEIGVALCILAVVALWRFTPPPRIIARAESIQPVFFHLHTPQAMAEITITPAHGRQPAAMAISLMASRSEEHTSELQSLMRISYAVFCLKKKKKIERSQRQLTFEVNTNI